VYFRYYVYYPSTYYWPGEEALFENVKMFNLAGDIGWDIEFIYKSSAVNGPDSLQLYWYGADGTITGNGTVSGSATLGSTLDDDAWHKVEIYIKIGTAYADQAIHVQVDDYDVYEDTGESVNFRLPASAYTGTQQFISLRASNSPSAGHGVWYFDNITAVSAEGDLCDNEPSEAAVHRGGGSPSGFAGSFQ
jgi:hypothetical protein